MAMQTVPLTLRWRIEPGGNVTLQVQRNNGVTPKPVLEATLTANQLVTLIAEHACRAQGLVWTTKEAEHA